MELDDPPPADSEDSPGLSFADGIYVVIGSLGLITAIGADALAVLGRHTGFSLLGSIEIVQCAIVVLASASMVLTTKAGGHATIRILTERLPPPTAAVLARISSLLAVCYCLALILGCFWVTAETWGTHERSELLQIPYKWLRLCLLVATGLMAGYFIRRGIRRIST